jgi:hypothetical protein
MATGARLFEAIGERAFAFVGEGLGEDFVRLEVERIVDEDGEHDTVGIDAGAAEHVANADRPKSR